MSAATAGPAVSPAAGAWLALAFVVPSLLFQVSSIAALPGVFGHHFAKGVEAVALALLGVWLVRQGRLPVPGAGLALAMSFVLDAVLSGVWSCDSVGFDKNTAILLHHAAVAPVLFVAVRDRRGLDLALVGWQAASFVFAVLVVVEAFYHGWRLDRILTGQGRGIATATLWEDGSGGYYRANGPLGHPNLLGVYLGTALLLAPYLWVRYRAPAARWILATAVLVEAYALMRGVVRLGPVGLAAGGTWFACRALGMAFRRWGWRRLLLAAVALLATGVAVAPLLPSAWTRRTFDLGKLRSSDSVAFRVRQLDASMELVARHAVAGVGHGGYGAVFHREADAATVASSIRDAGWRAARYMPSNLGAHNTYLEVCIEQGVVGLGLWCGAWAVLLVGLWRSGRRWRDDPPAWVLGRVIESMVVAVGVMAFALHLQDQRVVWIVIGLAAVYVRLAGNGALAGGSALLPPRLRRAAVVGYWTVLAAMLAAVAWRELR